MEFHIVIPVLISFAISAVLGPVIIPFLRKLKMGTDRENRGRTVASEKGRNPDYGRRDLSDIHDYYFIVLCKRLSQDYPGSVPDSGIRTDRFSG